MEGQAAVLCLVYLDTGKGFLELDADVTVGVMLFIQSDGFALGERLYGVGFSLPTSEIQGEVSAFGCLIKKGVSSGPFPIVTVPIIVTGNKGCGVRAVALAVDDL
jgi:hypothetical protein